MVRGWARWRTGATAPPPALSLYVTARDVLYDLDARRLDITRNLAPDTLEFWLEIQRWDGEVERYLHVEPSDLGVRQVLERYDIEGDQWGLDLIPHPCLRWGNWTIQGVGEWEARHPGKVLGLETLGVLPGSTLRGRGAIERYRVTTGLARSSDSAADAPPTELPGSGPRLSPERASLCNSHAFAA
jgi:hypothetical protein